MKTTKADFEYFKECCQYYLKKYGITEYTVWIEHEKLSGAVGECSFKSVEKCATLKLNTSWSGAKTKADIKETAKHEVVHVLLGKLSEYGRSRYVTPDELTEAIEEVVNRLAVLLPD